MPARYHSRHAPAQRSSPPINKYSPEAFREYVQTPLQRDADDEALLQELRQRRPEEWSQHDQTLFDEIMDRNEQREDLRRAPLRRDLESLFDHLGLPPLPPPLPKSSLWQSIRSPSNYWNAEVRPFLVACWKGELDEVRRWVPARKDDVLLQIGVDDGLSCAAGGNQPDVARYLLDEGGATVRAAVIGAACRHRSLLLLKLCVQHGYHPDQQVPSNDGHFGVALTHCLEDDDITRFLLERGADPDVAPFHDNRKLGWGQRAAPPMDRTSGLALDRAVEKGSFNTVQMLLDHGAKTQYARPLQRVIERHAEQQQKQLESQWRPLMEILIRHNTDVNGKTYGAGTPLISAVAKKMWDIAEFLVESGADPRIKHPISGLDAFAMAAKGAGIPWETEGDIDHYLSRLCGGTSLPDPGDSATAPALEMVRRNPLVQIVEEVKARRNE